VVVQGEALLKNLHCSVIQAGSTHNVVRTASAKFGFYDGNVKFNMQIEEWLSMP
jgi:hypothetical protein